MSYLENFGGIMSLLTVFITNFLSSYANYNVDNDMIKELYTLKKKKQSLPNARVSDHGRDPLLAKEGDAGTHFLSGWAKTSDV